MTAKLCSGRTHAMDALEGEAINSTSRRLAALLGAYRWTVVGLFILTVGLKLHSLVSGEIKEWEIDPALGLSTLRALQLAVLAEFAVVILAIFNHSQQLVLIACLFVFGAFLVYHGFSFFQPSVPPCNCLGASLSKKILSGSAGRVAMASLSGVMFLSSALLLRSLSRAPAMPGPLRSGKVAVLMFLCAISTTLSNVRAAVFEANGEVSVEFLGFTGVRIEQPSYETPVTIRISDDGRFIIRLGHHPAFRSQDITFSFDGTNFFYVFAAKTRPKEGEGPNEAGTGPATAYLSTGEIPLILFQDDARDALWLAFGSGRFLAKNGPTGELVNLFFSPRTDVNAYGFRYEARLTNSTIPLAYELHLRKDRSLDKKSAHAEEERIELDLKGKRTDLRRKQWGMKETWRDGDRGVDLVWQRGQLIDGNSLPLEIAVTTYHPSPHSDRPRHKIGIRIDSWREVRIENESFQPSVRAPIRVIDSRLRARNGSHFVDDVLYEIGRTNSQWPSTNDVSLQRAFTGMMEASRRPDAIMPQVLRLLLFAIAAGGLVITVILLVRQEKNAKPV